MFTMQIKWLIFATYGADLINISKVTSRKTKWLSIVWPTMFYISNNALVSVHIMRRFSAFNVTLSDTDKAAKPSLYFTRLVPPQTKRLLLFVIRQRVLVSVVWSCMQKQIRRLYYENA